MSHYDEQREKDAMKCRVSQQINEHVNIDNDCITCPDCGENADEIMHGFGDVSYVCPRCETEIEIYNDEY